LLFPGLPARQGAYMNYLDLLRDQFNDHVALREKRPGVMQLIAPLYHADGDMMDIFLEKCSNGHDRIRVSDHGLTLMRLSYSYDLDTPNKERILQRMLGESGVSEDNGKLFMESEPDSLYPTIMQFAQTVAKVSNMRLCKREIIQSLFYEQLREFVQTTLQRFNPEVKVLPVPNRDDLEVDYRFLDTSRQVFLFGVKDTDKARLTAISCLEFRRADLRFNCAAVHEDFDSLPRKDKTRLTSAVDKQFVSLADFRENGSRYLAQELA
jgi:hypothetical protein